MTPSGIILGKPDKPGGAYGGPDKPPSKKKRPKPKPRKPQISSAKYIPGKTEDPRKKPENPPDSDIPKHEHEVSPVLAAAERYLKRKAS